MSRFDYVKYDHAALTTQAEFKYAFESIAKMAENMLESPRAKSLVLTKLEEAYAWTGKAIRDDQISRNGSAQLQEGRGNE